MLEDLGNVEVVGDEAVAVVHGALRFGSDRGRWSMASEVYASARKALRAESGDARTVDRTQTDRKAV